jgi:RNAse (barnase) inhibitor barstar
MSKSFSENLETHYSKVLKDIDKELEAKFESLEREKTQAAKIKARIQDLPKEEEEEFVALVQENAENIRGKKKANRK